MTTYVLLALVMLGLGMAASVWLFGTGGKRHRIFSDVYYSIEDVEGMGVAYTKLGEFSACLAFENPVQRFSGDADSYYEYSSLFNNIAMALGEDYAMHKQDVFTRRRFHDPEATKREFLSESYFRYFDGRMYTDSATFLTITQENKKAAFMTYDEKKWNDFKVKVRKVHDLLRDAGLKVRILTKDELSEHVDRCFTMDFTSPVVSFDNLDVDGECIHMGGRKCKVYSLVDVDDAGLPGEIRPFANIEVNNASMPVDLMTALADIPGGKTVIFNQMVYMPGQRKELAALEKKKNRHASMPNPSNQIAVEDITRVQDIIARESKMLCYLHYNIMVCTDEDEDLQKPTNYLDNAFSRIGVHMSKRAYNQLELFAASLPGNCYRMNPDYDRFLTLADASACLMYKERIQHSEDTPLKVYYTDRQGVPVAIDISGKEGREKLTDNSNFFCLGPSGSGKSFHMNSVVRQLWEQDTDVVMVDTGNSYEGLCEYVGGKYISYTEEKPITMNPFNITKGELNIEKVDFLKNLILLLWRGSDATVSELESRVVEQIVNDYYADYFAGGFQGYTPDQRETLRKCFVAAEKRHPSGDPGGAGLRIANRIAALEQRRRGVKIPELSFNSFYDYSVERLDQIVQANALDDIDPNNYSFMLQPFYRGGVYEKILNEAVDSTLFDETFIVFEIDAIKDNKKLFPIVTLIIMDVFIQKMRIKKNRKVLVIEEAWKAIASPLMAEYIKYLYKTARKFWAMVGVVTQEIQDIVGSPIVKEAIINNSDITLLLDQSKFKERFSDIKAILGLTEVDCKKIFTINRLDNKDGRSFFREVFIRRGSTSAVYGVEEPHECYMTYTTERAEKDALKLYKAELRCSHQDAIEAYCRDWERSGVAKSLPFAQMVHKAGHVLNLPAPAAGAK